MTPIMLGNCLYHFIKKKSFLQDWSGYIMIRKMAKLFVDNSSRWLSETNSYDDYKMNKFLACMHLFVLGMVSLFSIKIILILILWKHALNFTSFCVELAFRELKTFIFCMLILSSYISTMISYHSLHFVSFVNKS